MNRIKVSILLGNEPNFNVYAFKYFLLSLNKIQKTYEYGFPDIHCHIFEENETINFNTCLEETKSFKDSNFLKSDHIIVITTKSFDNNFFFNASDKISIITTDIWDKHFSPPSLFEYLLHSIYTCLIYSGVRLKNEILTQEQRSIDIGSHPETKGCIADFTRNKFDDKVDILTGYICDEHSKDIRILYGEEYLIELTYIIERNWIGTKETKNSVAYNLKHVFKFDINKDSGFDKTWKDKVIDHFYEIPGSLITEIIKVIITIIITYLLIKAGFELQ